MTKQEEIREGIEHVITVNRPYVAGLIAEKVVEYLHSQGVVIKVEGELPHCEFVRYSNWHKLCPLLNADYVAVEPLL